jgi:hypothetical protein
MVEMPPQPGIARVYTALLTSIGVPFRRTVRIDVLEPLALAILRKVEARIGGITRLIENAAIDAIVRGSERVDASGLMQVRSSVAAA